VPAAKMSPKSSATEETAEEKQKKTLKTNDQLVEEAWNQLKKETPAENSISGQETSQGQIRAREELFDNSNDPKTVVKCFLLIDSDRRVVGIHSVDSTINIVAPQTSQALENATAPSNSQLSQEKLSDLSQNHRLSQQANTVDSKARELAQKNWVNNQAPEHVV